MNKIDRRKLTSAARRYCNTTIQALQEFSAVTEEIKSREEEKLENMPESLRDTSIQSTNISEAIEQLEEIAEYFDSIEEACTAIADMTGIHIEYHEAVSHPESKADDGPRKNRVQILLSDYIFALLKLRALAEGCSNNELICRALLNELLKDPSQ